MRKALFDALKSVGRRFGLFISYYPPPGSYHRFLRDYLRRMEINVVLDVGGFVGDWARELLEIGYRGRIISFEPVPDSFAKLKQSMEHNPQWSGLPFGLSDENRTTVINTYSKGNFNSLLELRPDEARWWSVDASQRTQTTIQLRRLDSVLPELLDGLQSPRVFLKLDTQGHDVNVVRGATGVLDRITGIQSELPVVHAYDGMICMRDALDFYANLGFVPINFQPVNTIENEQITPEFDVLLNRLPGKLGNSPIAL
jgi:FkbM family methyltransferase